MREFRGFNNADEARAAGFRVILGQPLSPPPGTGEGEGWGQHFAPTEDLRELEAEDAPVIRSWLMDDDSEKES